MESLYTQIAKTQPKFSEDSRVMVSLLENRIESLYEVYNRFPCETNLKLFSSQIYDSIVKLAEIGMVHRAFNQIPRFEKDMTYKFSSPDLEGFEFE